MLGHTLPEIAAEKAGIFKRGAPAVTVPQRPDAMQTLMVCASASGAPDRTVCVAGVCKCIHVGDTTVCAMPGASDQAPCSRHLPAPRACNW